jgi:hypothetical protein
MGFPSGLFPSGFPTRTLYTPLLSPISDTGPYINKTKKLGHILIKQKIGPYINKTKKLGHILITQKIGPYINKTKNWATY